MPTLLLGVLLFGHQSKPRPPDTAGVRRIASESGAEVAVAFRMLDGSGEMFIEPDKPFHAASTMKTPVMIELFRSPPARSRSRIS